MSQTTCGSLARLLKIGLLSEILCDRVSSCHFSNHLLGSCFSPTQLGKSRPTRARSTDQHHHIPNLTGNASLYYICQIGLASRLKLSKLGRRIRDCSMDVESIHIKLEHNFYLSESNIHWHFVGAFPTLNLLLYFL